MRDTAQRVWVLLRIDQPWCETYVSFSKDLVSYGLETLAHSDLGLTNPDRSDEVRTFGKERLPTFALDIFPGQHVETFTQLGEAGSVIRELVQHQGADLVMLATHGRGPIRRFLLGSVAV